METLNNVNVVIGVITGLITIGTTIFAAIKYLQKKVTSSQQKQVLQPTSSLKRPSYQGVPKSLNKLDWMEVLWTGLEDCIRAKDGSGWMTSFGVGIIGGVTIAMFSSLYGSNIVFISLTIFFTLYIVVNLLFYFYFVGRRIEEKVEEMDQSLSQKSKRIQNY